MWTPGGLFSMNSRIFTLGKKALLVMALSPVAKDFQVVEHFISMLDSSILKLTIEEFGLHFQSE